MTAQEERRASGRLTSEEIAREVSKTADDPIEVTEPGERDLQFDTPGFGRIRTDLRGDDARVLKQVEHKINQVLWEEFWALYTIQDAFQSLVRDPLMRPDDPTKPLLDEGGHQAWARDPVTGLPVEDWTRLTDAWRYHYQHQIMNMLFGWEQSAEKLRGRSLFAKAKWEELFAAGFESLPTISATRPTVDDREHRAKRIAAEERYYAVFMSSLSRRADALVKSMVRLHDDLERSLRR